MAEDQTGFGGGAALVHVKVGAAYCCELQLVNCVTEGTGVRRLHTGSRYFDDCIIRVLDPWELDFFYRDPEGAFVVYGFHLLAHVCVPVRDFIVAGSVLGL
jgi:hypothetical protein